MPEYRPKRLRVLGQYYSIIPVPGLSDPPELALATVECSERQIKYEPALDEEILKEALFHEIIHIGERMLSLEEDYITEDQVMKIAGIVFSILRDNPTLTTWILKEEEEE